MVLNFDMEEAMKVSIEDIKSDDGCGNSITYIATSEDDCRDSVDREVYKLVVECNDQILMGSVLGIPMGGSNE